MRRGLIFAAVLGSLSACYSAPGETSCTVACGVGGSCPGDFQCRANNVCGAPGDMCTGAITGDAANDATTDGAIDGRLVDGRICYGHGVAPFLSVCPAVMPSGTLDFVNTNLRTGIDCTFTVAQAAGPDVCVIAANTISISGSVRVTGARPLLLLGAERVEVNSGAVLDIASHSGSVDVGAGSPGPGCATSGGLSNSLNTAGGGGAGGSFGGAGGNGEIGGGNGTGGFTQGMQPSNVFRSGCPGGAGGNAGLNDGGSGGGAGGGIYLMAGTQIVVGGTINASGAGASRAEVAAGGGGGGSGGMIVLDAPMLTISGKMFALGGGGSSGGSGDQQGNPGNDPTGVGGYAFGSIPNGSAGMGGTGGTPLTGLNGSAGGGNGDGGGGGGGGGGVIRTWPASGPLPGNADPPAS